MQAQMIERRSWRRQIHELFIDPIGSPEVWNEMSSYGGRALTPRDWCNLAFDAGHSGHLNLLKWIISSKKVPILIRNRKGCNLLHAAVSYGQESIAEWLVDRHENCSAIELFLSKSKRGRTALETAVRSNRFGMVGCLLNVDLMGTPTLTSQIIDVVRHCCKIAEPSMAVYVTNYLQTMEIRALLFEVSMRSDQNVDSFTAQVSAFPWWENVGNIEWNELEKFALYVALLSAARRLNKDLIEWLLNKWKASLEPPSLYRWKELSIADLVAIGNIGDDEFLEKCSGDTEGDDDQWKHYSKRWFDMMASVRWEDGQSSSIISTLEPLFYENELYHSLKNKWLEALCEHGYERRLAVLRILSQKYDDDGAQFYSLPRLDLVVACGQLHTLQWLIDSKFVNLDALLSSNVEAMEVDERDEVTPADDNVCAICYGVKRFPQELQCGHSYCLSCISQVHSYAHNNLQSFQCPYCRRHITAPPLMTVNASFQYYLALKSPWLQYQSSNTIGQILMALAAGTGSVFILEYLITEQQIDPLRTVFADGRNVLHLAASRGNVVACKWLCLNGYLELASRLSDQQLSPVHETINCPIHSASLVFDLFEELKVLPDDWIVLASTSPNAAIVRSAEFFLSHERSTQINELLAMNAPLDQLTPLIEKSSFGRCEILDDKFIQSMMGSIIQYGRADVLSWLYVSSSDRRYLYFDLQKEFICTRIGKCNVNCSAMDAFINEVHAVDEASRQIGKCTRNFIKLILNGATIADIEEVINRQNGLIGQARSLKLNGNFYKISFKDIIQHGLNALETAARHGHLHLVDWILNMPNLNTRKSLKQVFSRAIEDGNFDLFDFALSWLDKYNQPVPTSIDIFKTKHTSLLHAVVDRFTLCCSGLSSGEEANVSRACFEMAKRLIGRSDIDINALNNKKQTALYCLARVHCNRKGEVISDVSHWIFEMIEMLVNAGLDLGNIDVDNQTFFELVLSEGSPLLLKSVRWLALDKGVDVQFVQYSCFLLDDELQQQTEDEFKAIREEQRVLKLLQQ